MRDSLALHREDFLRKLSVYARERVAHARLVDPELRTLDIFRLENTRWLVVEAHGGEEAVHAEPFEAITLDLPLIWPDPPSTGR